MVRRLIVTGLLAVAIVSALALSAGAKPVASGPVPNAGKWKGNASGVRISFQVLIGKTRTIDSSLYVEIDDASCSMNSSGLYQAIGKSIPVQIRERRTKFSGDSQTSYVDPTSGNTVTSTMSIQGQFTSETQASGTVQLTRTGEPFTGDCDSGPRSWTAARKTHDPD